MAVTSTNLDYLLPFLRQRVGDTTAGSYRFADEWLQTALVGAVWALERRWNRKYLIDENNDVYRNTDEWVYRYDSPPIIQHQDVEPILLKAAIIILEGSLEEMSWGLGSWRDAEISYSNIASGRVKSDRVNRLEAELDSLLQPAGKKLRNSLKGSLPGYRGNTHESAIDY